MAILNEILVGRYARALQKLFSMKGPPPVRALAGEVGATVSLFFGAECRYLEGWNRFGQVASALPVAGQFSQLRLRNPSGSNVIAVIEKIFVANEVGAPDQPILSHGAAGVDLATLITPTNMRFDPRGNPQPALVFSSTTAAGTGALASNMWSTGMAVNSFADVISTDIHEVPLLPGEGLHYASGIVNQQATVTFWWRERGLEESERT